MASSGVVLGRRLAAGCREVTTESCRGPAGDFLDILCQFHSARLDLVRCLATAALPVARREALSRMGDDMPAAGCGPLFWWWLLIWPGLIAVVATVVSGVLSALPTKSWDTAVLPHAYVAAVFSLASVQCVLTDWYRRNVEGALPFPAWVHVCAGASELIVVAFRLNTIYDPEDVRLIALATVGTAFLMGGAAWTWLVEVQRPTRLLPALLVLLATWATRPVFPAIEQCILLFATMGFFAAGVLIWLCRPAEKKKRKKKKKAVEDADKED